jgi:hypothetical protein
MLLGSRDMQNRIVMIVLTKLCNSGRKLRQLFVQMIDPSYVMTLDLPSVVVARFVDEDVGIGTTWSCGSC